MRLGPGVRGRLGPALGLAAAGLALWLVAGAAGAAERVALVIGNSAYEHVSFLPNPVNDAKAVGDAFESLGYTVTRLMNKDRHVLHDGLISFKKAARGKEVAVVFYAGHGIGVGGNNFLVPVDAELGFADDVEDQTIPLTRLMSAVGNTRHLGLVILDACRNNPFVKSMEGDTRSIERGLAQVEPTGRTMVAYAAKGGQVALDGDGDHSPYTEALLKYLREAPGLPVRKLFGTVRDAVEADTEKRFGRDRKQVPWAYHDLGGSDYYLVASASAPIPTPEDEDTGTSEARAYEAAERLNTVAGYRAFIKRFPGSYEAELAQGHIDKLEGKSKPLVVAGGDPDDAVVSVPPGEPTPEEVEQGLGLSDETKRLVQMGLAAAGHDPGYTDGLIGPSTRGALRSWQRGRGLEATGYLTKEQSEALVALGREESARRRAEAERERKAREAEERRRAEAEREARQAEERRRAEAERKEREAHETAPLRRFTERLGRPFSAEFKSGAAGWTDMHYAALLDLPGVVTALVDAGMDVDTRLKSGALPFSDYLKRTLAAVLGHKGFEDWKAFGQTPLMLAATGNARKAVEALIARGADVNAKNDTGATPLYYAAANDFHDVAKLLIERGADVNAKNNNGWAPLHTAAWRDSHDVAKLLIERSADVNAKNNDTDTPLFTAARYNAHDVAKLLIDRGADVNAQNSKSYRNETPLHAAAKADSLDVAKLLIDRGVAVNVKNSDHVDYTPLHFAAKANSLDVAKLLIDRGADVNAVSDEDEQGAIPLHFAAEENSLDVAKLLIDRGADVNAKDSFYGYTPLHFAAKDNFLDVAKLLIDRGADVNSVVSEEENEGMTPLHFAAYASSLDVAKLLIDRGAAVNAKDKDDETPLHEAAWGNSLDVAKLLIDRGADVNAKEYEGWTPLDAAIDESYGEMQAMLRRHGARCAKEC